MNKKMWISIGGLGFFGLGGTVSLITAMAITEIKSPVATSEIKFSTTTGSENLIEIFTDGFDYNHQIDNFKNNEDFKDFHMFSNFYTQGAPTYVGKVTSFGGFTDYNSFKIRKRHPNVENGMNVFNTDEMINAYKKHYEIQADKFRSKDLLGLYDLGNLIGSTQSATDHVKEALKDINITSFTGARDLISGSWGITNNSPDANLFDTVSKAAKIDNTSAKGARVIISDITTHDIKLSGSNGELNLDTDLTKASKGIQSNINRLMRSLKNLKENDKSVYDNSMILVWGDHSDHSAPENTNEEKILRARSNLLIKFPHESNLKIDIVEDKLIYAPQINSIINDYFNNKPINPLTIFDSARFALTRKMYTYFNEIYIPSIYSLTKKQLVEDASRQILQYDEDLVDEVTSQLLEEMMGGRNE